MKHYPLFLNLENKKVAVFGGGAVAARKVKTLLECGAKVTVTSRDFSKELLGLAKKNGRSQLSLKRFSPHPTPLPQGGEGRVRGLHSFNLKEVVLVFAASSDRGWNRQIVRECRRQKIWVNAADDPEFCDFFVPSVFKKGKLQIAISTGGASPLLARRFREELSKKIRPEAVKVLSRLERLRPLAKRKISSQRKRLEFFEEKAGKDFHFLENGK